MPSASDLAVRVRGLSKAYTIAHRADRPVTLAESLLARARRPFARTPTETFWALKDVEFDIKKGDVVGIIGRNGAGKSTLLKILSRITEPTTGTIDLYGRVGSLLEVGTGFHPELTGRENVFLNGAILGMTKGEIRRQFDAIVDFAGVEQFLDTPVKRYSSGMYVRLAFAVAAHLNPEILIVDEVLAVGDAEFQRKCLGKMKDVSAGGRTVLFVSHNLGAVQSLCGGGVYLAAGSVVVTGAIDLVLSRYRSATPSSQGADLATRVDRTGGGQCRLDRLAIMDDRGLPLSAVDPGQPFRIRLTGRVTEPIERLEASIDVDAPDGTRLVTLYSGLLGVDFAWQPGPFCLECSVPAGLGLRPDLYTLNAWVGNVSEGKEFDLICRAASLEVSPTDFFGNGRLPPRQHGVMMAPYGWSRPGLAADSAVVDQTTSTPALTGSPRDPG